jgi:hypothetical protein
MKERGRGRWRGTKRQRGIKRILDKKGQQIII